MCQSCWIAQANHEFAIRNCYCRKIEKKNVDINTWLTNSCQMKKKTI
jgi:hypothetical protein